MRTIVLIDGGYLNAVLDQEFARPKIDYGRLARLLAGERDLLRTYYHYCEPYVGEFPTDEDRMRLDQARKFLNAIALQPRFEVRLGRLEYRGTTSEGRPIVQQKRVDLQIGLDLVMHAFRGHIDEAIMITGDSDLIPAIEAAKREGVVVTLVHGDSPHRDLLRTADERRRLTFADIDAVRVESRAFAPIAEPDRAADGQLAAADGERTG